MKDSPPHDDPFGDEDMGTKSHAMDTLIPEQKMRMRIMILMMSHEDVLCSGYNRTTFVRYKRNDAESLLCTTRIELGPFDSYHIGCYGMQSV